MLLAVHYRVIVHTGSLENTREAKVALSYRLKRLLRFFVLSLVSACITTRQRTLKHEPIVNFKNIFKVKLA